MSRTTRTILTDANHREARHGAANAEAAWRAQTQWKRFHGGMVMSPHASGIWGDERGRSGKAWSGHMRDAQRRTAKRRERREAMRFEAAQLLAAAAEDAAEVRAYFVDVREWFEAFEDFIYGDHEYGPLLDAGDFA